MVDLVPIKVILRHKNADGSRRVDQNGGKTVFPSFRSLPNAILDGRDPSNYVDEEGTGWCINRQENLGKGDAFGEAVTLVPPEFAAAAASIVDSCEILSEADCADFLDNKHFKGMATTRRDGDALTALAAERDLRMVRARPAAEITALDAEIDRALDPDDPTPGVTRISEVRSWADMKAKRKINIPT